MTFHPLHPLPSLGIVHKMSVSRLQPNEHQLPLHFLTISFVGECAGNRASSSFIFCVSALFQLPAQFFAIK